MSLNVGDRAPDFDLTDEYGNRVSLNGFRGKNVVLYFYPKDDTPGCTREACSFTDEMDKFAVLNAVVLGISRDSVESHLKFKRKYDLNVRLLSDSDAKVCDAYGVFVEKMLYGRRSKGIERSTFLIDKEGVIEQIWRKVKVDDHIPEVLAALK